MVTVEALKLLYTKLNGSADVSAVTSITEMLKIMNIMPQSLKSDLQRMTQLNM